MILAFISCAGAQTLTTNWITASPEFREVNGQLYNTDKSVRFINLSGQCLAVFTNGCLLQLIDKRPIYETARNYRSDADPARVGNFIGGGGRPEFYRRKIGEEEVQGDTIFLQNYPGALHRGSRLQCRAICVGKMQHAQETYSAYDFGLPHVVPVVVTNQVTP